LARLAAENANRELQMANDRRRNMVRSAANLISSHGVSATSFSHVLADSGAPRGSIYHHFPEGKRQLAEAAIGWASDRVLEHQRACLASTPSEVVAWFIDLWRQSVLASGAMSGCAVAGVAIDTGGDGDLIGVVRTTFRSWVTLLADQLSEVGVPSDQAVSIATTALAAIEGALILCRAEGGVEPLNAVAGLLLSMLATQMPVSASR